MILIDPDSFSSSFDATPTHLPPTSPSTPLEFSTPNPDLDKAVYDILALPLGCLIIIANICALGSMVYNRHLQHPAYRYVASLAVTDTGVGIYLIVVNSTGENPLAADNKCVARICVVMALCIVSILSILVIATDRYLFLIHAVYYYQLATFRYSAALLAVVWISGTLVGFVPLMGWVNTDQDGGAKCNFIDVVADEYIILMIVLFFTVPMLLITVLYGRILHLVVQQRRRMLQQTQPLYEQPFHTGSTPRRSSLHSRSGIGLLRGLRAAKVVILIVAAFLVTWFPFFVVTFVQIICGSKCHAMDAVGPYLSLLGFFNSLLNPCIYAFFGLDLRQNSCSFSGICEKVFTYPCKARKVHIEPHPSFMFWRVM